MEKDRINTNLRAVNKMQKHKWLITGLVVYLLSIATITIAKTPGEDFKIKGFHLDLRVQVMTMPELKRFALKLSKNGINTLLMEWEATYPYEKHSVISSRYAYTREEVKSFIAYCNSLGIDVVPLQQSFGHVEYILKHSRYKDLREDQKDFSQVNPLREKLCKELFTDLFKDMIEMHHSPYIHIGGDETYLLGKSPESQKKVEQVGKGRLYGDYIKMLAEVVVSMGKRPILWADIALKYPDALEGLPKETIFTDWNYGWDLNRFGDHSKLMETGYEIWGSPAIRSSPDNYFLTVWDKHFENINIFIPFARKLGYKGIVMTSWSTSGIYSPIFESATEVVDLPAVRRVYPQTGFNMLIAAYFQSLKQQTPLDRVTFMNAYCKENYGFTIEQTHQFWSALSAAPLEVNYNAVRNSKMSIKNLLDTAVAASKLLYALKPTKYSKEFDHYLLMADIRNFYLTCMWLESEINNRSYDFTKAPKLLAELNKLNPASLDKRFIELNKHAYYPSELDTENHTRNIRYQILKDKLANNR
jgi:hypothetical protein